MANEWALEHWIKSLRRNDVARVRRDAMDKSFYLFLLYFTYDFVACKTAAKNKTYGIVLKQAKMIKTFCLSLKKQGIFHV